MDNKNLFFQITLISILFIISFRIILLHDFYKIFTIESIHPRILLALLLFFSKVFTLVFLSYGCSLFFIRIFSIKRLGGFKEFITGLFSLFTYVLIDITLPANLTKKLDMFVFLFVIIFFSITLIFIQNFIITNLKVKLVEKLNYFIFLSAFGVFLGFFCLMAMAYRNLYGETAAGFIVLLSGFIVAILSMLISAKSQSNKRIQ